MTPFLLRSSSGKRLVLVQGGFMRFEQANAPDFEIYGLLVDQMPGNVITTPRP
jgi:hypothetical protein